MVHCVEIRAGMAREISVHFSNPVCEFFMKMGILSKTSYETFLSFLWIRLVPNGHQQNKVHQHILVEKEATQN